MFDVAIRLTIEEALSLRELIWRNPEFGFLQELVDAGIDRYTELADYRDEIRRTDI